MDLGIDGLGDAVEIGRGGFSVVYSAEEVGLNRRVAVKVMTSSLDERGRVRFEREQSILGGLSQHPNIVSLLRSGLTPSGNPFLVMPYLSGGSLADRLSVGPLPETDVTSIGIAMCDGLSAAHRMGVVHCDLKPGNVLITDYGHYQIADFGISRFADATATATSMATTPAYGAPEIIRGAPPSVASDIYGLGATLHALLKGSAPFSTGENTNLFAIMQRVLEQPPDDLRQLDVSVGLVVLIEQLMAKDPSDRPADADQVRESLLALQDSAGLAPSIAPVSTGMPAGSGPAVSGDDTDQDSTVIRTFPEPHQSPGSTSKLASPARPPTVAYTSPDAPSTAEHGLARNWLGKRTAIVIPAALIVAAVAVIAVAALLSRNSGSSTATTPTAATSRPATTSPPATTEPVSHKVIKTITVGNNPGTPIVANGLIWVPNLGDDTVTVINPATVGVTKTITVGNNPGTPVVADGLIWVPDWGDGTVSVVNPATVGVTKTITVGKHPGTPMVADGLIWVPNSGDGTVSVIDPATVGVTKTITVGNSPWTPMVADGLIWVVDWGDGTVSVIDPATVGVTRTITVGNNPRTPMVADGLIWVPNSGDGTVSVIDPATVGVTRTITVGNNPWTPVAANGLIWVPNNGDGTVSVINQ